MKFLKYIGLSLTLGVASVNIYGGAGEAWNNLVRSRGSVSSYPSVVKELLDDNLYFTAIPYLKEYLSRSNGNISKEVDFLIDQVVTQVGVRQFEVLPRAILNRTKAPIMRYILAKKYFRVGDYNSALKALNGTIPRNHPAKPFALLLEGSIFSIKKSILLIGIL